MTVLSVLPTFFNSSSHESHHSYKSRRYYHKSWKYKQHSINVFHIQVSVAVRWCSTQSEECQDLLEFMKDAQLDVGPCQESNATSLSLNTDSPSKR